MREVAAERERPALLFSGGKDSIVLLRLAEKAFRPAAFPFPVMHIDTGHNFPEVLDFRDRRVRELDERLVVASVQESIDIGRATELLRSVVGELSYRNLDEEPGFAGTNTTTEVLARHVADRLAAGIRAGELGPAVPVTGLVVTLHESHVAWASYERSL